MSGTAWLDREWLSQSLANDQAGWDWFSLSFDTGEKLMGFSLREGDGGSFTSATWIGADGLATPYGDGQLAATPLETNWVDGRHVPTRWRLVLPERKLDVTVSALNTNAGCLSAFPIGRGLLVFWGPIPAEVILR